VDGDGYRFSFFGTGLSVRSLLYARWRRSFFFHTGTMGLLRGKFFLDPGQRARREIYRCENHVPGLCTILPRYFKQHSPVAVLDLISMRSTFPPSVTKLSTALRRCFLDCESYVHRQIFFRGVSTRGGSSPRERMALLACFFTSFVFSG